MDMKFNELNPPRKFTVGKYVPIELSDYGKIELAPDELVTFVTEGGAEYDVGRKSWGFYATPSVNGRLQKFGFKTALVRNADNQYFVMLVERDKMRYFEQYLEQEQSEVAEWLDERSA
jgi:hypothetical protein